MCSLPTIITPQTSLNDILAILNRLSTEKYSNASILKWLADYVAPASIIVVDAKELSNKRPKSIKLVMREYDSLSLPDKIEDIIGGRIMFKCNVYAKLNEFYLLRYQCRGVVIDIKNMRILAMPPQPFRYSYEIATVDNNLRRGYYDIYKVRDGTTITLYYYDGSLRMSTASSIDISRQIWNNDKTFLEMFYESASQVPGFIENTQLTVEDVKSPAPCSITTANNSKYLKWKIAPYYSVTFGFRHQNIQPIKDDPSTIWLIRIYNMKTREDVNMLPELVNVPRNETIDSSNIQSVNDLYKLFEHDVRDAVTSSKFNYGYFLNAKNDNINLRSYNRVLIASKLHSIIEKFFYEKVRFNGTLLLGENKYLFNILRLILTMNYNAGSMQRLNAICDLVPEYKRLRDECIKYIDILADRIQHCIRNPTGISNETNSVVICLYNHIITNEPDLISSPHNAGFLIRSYIQSTKYLGDIYQAILQEMKE